MGRLLVPSLVTPGPAWFAGWAWWAWMGVELKPERKCSNLLETGKTE